MKTTWKKIDEYFEEKIGIEDPFMEAFRSEVSISPLQGQCLYLLTKIINANKVLELGTHYGYSTMWLARGLAEGGKIVTMEKNQDYLAKAEQGFQTLGWDKKIAVLEGDIHSSLVSLRNSAVGPFDLVFIDADKENNDTYLSLVLELSRSGTLIIADNVVRGGKILRKKTNDEKVKGVQRYMEHLPTLGTLETIAMQTVGAKGYDGFTISRVK
jgi:predicted O-methyltransferase YrrM